MAAIQPTTCRGAVALDRALGGRHRAAWHGARLGVRLGPPCALPCGARSARHAVDRDQAALAQLQGVAAEVVAADLEAAPWPLPGRRFDAVVVTNYLWRALLPAIVASVAEDGLLLYETFALGQEKLGRPSNPEFLLRPGELLSTAPGSAGDRVRRRRWHAPPSARVQRLTAWRFGAADALPRRRSGRARQALEFNLKLRSTMKPIVGSIVALVTPMLDNGRHRLRRPAAPDRLAHRRGHRLHRRGGHHRRVAHRHRRRALRDHPRRRRTCRGRVPIMAGAGGNSTHEAIELSRYAKKVGADCTLQVVPYYNRPSQEGIYRHFRAIAEAVDIPMVLYNVPGPHGGRHAARHGAQAGAGRPASSASRRPPATSSVRPG